MESVTVEYLNERSKGVVFILRHRCEFSPIVFGFVEERRRVEIAAGKSGDFVRRPRFVVKVALVIGAARRGITSTEPLESRLLNVKRTIRRRC